MKKIFFVVCAFLFTSGLYSQEDSIVEVTDTTVIENNQTVADEEIPLLPDRMIFTQRILWGRRGVMRNINYFSLSAEERQKEMEIRGTMLRLHKAAGYVTAVGMLAQSVVGILIYDGNRDYLNELHEGLGAGVDAGYATTMALSFLAPPSLKNPKKGLTGLKAHKILAVTHITGMIATNILAGALEQNRNVLPFHAAAAGISYVSLVASMIVVRF